MRSLFFLTLIILIAFPSCKKTKSESEKNDLTYAPYTEPWIAKKQKGINFFALGTEPFWNLEVGAKDQMKFFEMGKADTIVIPVPPLHRNKKNNSWSYEGKNPYSSLQVVIREGECSDNMSDNKYQYTVEVFARGENEREERKFFGCGSFLNDYRLNDVFALVHINGKDIKPEDSINGSPFIEMNVPTNKIMGKAGCNSFHGNMRVELNAAEIEFGPFLSTRMACPRMQLEDEFMKALSGNKVKYSFTKEGLMLTNGDNTLKFKKTD